MIRTQIYLTKELYQEIAFIAARENKAKAVVIRESLKKGLKKKKKSPSEVFLELSKNPIKGLPADLSTNIDKYLYED